MYAMGAVLLLFTAVWTHSASDMWTVVESYCGVLLYWGMAVGCILPGVQWRLRVTGCCLLGQGLVGLVFDIMGNQVALLSIGFCVVYFVQGAALVCAAVPEVKFLRWPHLQEDLVTFGGVLAILMVIVYGALALFAIVGMVVMAVRFGSWRALVSAMTMLLLPVSSVANLLLIRRCEQMGKSSKKQKKNR